MLKFIKNKNSKFGTIHLFSSILLISIFIPVLIYMNANSLTLYLTAEKLQNTIESSTNDTLQLLVRFGSKTTILLKSLQPENHRHISSSSFLITENKTNQKSKIPIAKVNKTVAPSSRPLTCKSCLDLTFKFLINNDVCSSKNRSIEILLLITSSPRNYLARKTIRNTWLTFAKQNKGEVRYVFLLGNSIMDEEIKKENNSTHDIVLGNFTDTYSNLTFKTLMGFHWTLQFCSKAKFILKTDDDMYVNIPALIKTIRNNNEALQTSVGGSCSRMAGPIRDKSSKWYASKISYPQKTYPGFCSGTGYVTSMHVVSKVVNISKDIPFFHLEDVYVSLCIKALGYKLLPFKGFLHRPNFNPCLYKDNSSVVTAHQVPLKWMRDIWNTPC